MIQHFDGIAFTGGFDFRKREVEKYLFFARDVRRIGSWKLYNVMMREKCNGYLNEFFVTR